MGRSKRMRPWLMELPGQGPQVGAGTVSSITKQPGPKRESKELRSRKESQSWLGTKSHGTYRTSYRSYVKRVMAFVAILVRDCVF